jgi:hypothetical protein
LECVAWGADRKDAVLHNIIYTQPPYSNNDELYEEKGWHYTAYVSVSFTHYSLSWHLHILF